MKKKLGMMGAGVAIATAAVIGTSSPALAAVGWADCPHTWSYTAADVTASAHHYHEFDTQWTAATKPAGYSSFKGFWSKGAVWMEINSTGTVSSPYFSCWA